MPEERPAVVITLPLSTNSPVVNDLCFGGEPGQVVDGLVKGGRGLPVEQAGLCQQEVARAHGQDVFGIFVVLDPPNQTRVGQQRVGDVPARDYRTSALGLFANV